ncbi:MAG: TetR/AcrR family transcriptional regulator [Actinomycetes bacterium]
MTPQALVSRLRRSDVARHAEILDAAIAELQDVGYDRMTMDAVAKRAGASKATLYRHWPNKAELVVAAIRQMRGEGEDAVPDTGTLRGDLLSLLAGKRTDEAQDQLCVMRGMVSACSTDAELATAFFEKVVDAKRSKAIAILQRAQARGEVSEATDIHFLVDAAPAMLVFRHLLTPHPVDEAYLTRLVDDVWLPLLTASTNTP